jgi:hypothetical protein
MNRVRRELRRGALRVGLQRFRYTAESLLPGRSAEWDERLGQTQGLLGEIHDLDVFRSQIPQESHGVAIHARELRRAIADKRSGCIEQYRNHMRGEGSLLLEWRAGLPHGKRSKPPPPLGYAPPRG